MAKELEVLDDEQALEALGIAGNKPPEEKVTTKEPDKKKEPVQQELFEEPMDTSEKVEEVAEKIVSSTQNEDGNITEAEKKRRGFQAEAMKFKNENDKLQAQIRLQQEQNRLLQEQNRQILGIIEPLQQKYNLPQQSQQVEEKLEEDFIQDGYFDPEKHRSWLKKRDDILAKTLADKIKNDIKADLKQESDQKTMSEQIAEVKKKFPDLVNPFTGEVDIDRMTKEVQNYTGQQSLVSIIAAARGVKPSAQQDISGFDKIKENANKPQSVVDQTEADVKPQEIPKGIKQIQKTFGDIDLPPNYDGLIE